MKKIIALILAVGCMLALVSCNRNKQDDNGPTVDAAAVAAMQEKLNASEPCATDITVKLTTELGALNSKYNVVYNEDDTATVKYFYEKFNSFDENDIKEAKSSFEGIVTVGADGSVTDEVGGTAFVESISFNIKLDPAKLSYSESAPGTLKVGVAAANTVAVLGVDLGADVEMVISAGADGVYSIAITYTSVSGVVELVSTYTYPVPEEDTEEGEENLEVAE